MSTVVNRMTLTPLFNRDLARYDIAHFWHDPDLSAVINIRSIYWKEISGVFSEMTLAEKNIKNAQIAAANIIRDKSIAKWRISNERVLRAFAEVVMDEINILRSEHNLIDRTLSQLVTAIKNKIDAGA